MAAARTLMLLRHCDTEPVRPGARDVDRALTARGRAQARALGDHLRAEGVEVGLVLCSPSTRTRETVAGLEVDADMEMVSELYEAGGDTIVELIRGLHDSVQVALIVGHAPGVPAAVYDLADPATSAPAAQGRVADRFPAGTLAVLEVRGAWSELADVRLVAARTAGA